MLKTKIKAYISWQRVLALIGLCTLIFISQRVPLFAQAVSEGFNTDQALQPGMIVKLKKGDSTKVEAVSSTESDQMHGVVVGATDATVTLANENQKVFVATSGHYNVLVSDQNGKVLTGDYIAVSAISGVGMKAGSREPFVIGRALAGFDGSSNVISTSDLKDTTGTSHKVNIGRVQVDIGVAKNPLLKADQPNLPGFLEKAATSIAGKPVNALRVYIAIVVFAISAVLAGTLLYGGVRSSVISIGRNPLSKKSILRTMIKIIITGMIVFITGVFGVYLILRL